MERCIDILKMQLKTDSEREAFLRGEFIRTIYHFLEDISDGSDFNVKTIEKIYDLSGRLNYLYNNDDECIGVL